MTTESLYPFLYGRAVDADELLADVARSTREMVAEIGRLRATMLASEGSALVS